MIESEILEIIADKDDDGSRLNEVADRFRRDLNVKHLLVLLDSSEPKLVSIGAWILSEIQFELYNMDSIVSRLYELTNHEVAEVRFYALSALFPALDREETVTQMLLDKMSNDPNEGVRICAQKAAEKLSIK